MRETDEQDASSLETAWLPPATARSELYSTTALITAVELSRQQQHLTQGTSLLIDGDTLAPAPSRASMAPAASANAAPLVSPLKQVNADPLLAPRKPKLHQTWEDLTSDPRLCQNQSTKQLQQYFAETWCLSPNHQVIIDCLNKLSTEQLLGEYRVSAETTRNPADG